MCLDKKTLSALLDQELLPKQRIRAEAHLRECSVCANHYRRLQQLQRVLRSVQTPRVTPTDQAWERFSNVLSETESFTKTSKKVSQRDRRFYGYPSWAAFGAVGMMLILTLGVNIFMITELRNSPASTVYIPAAVSPISSVKHTPPDLSEGPVMMQVSQTTVPSAELEDVFTALESMGARYEIWIPQEDGTYRLVTFDGKQSIYSEKPYNTGIFE